jgi:hypothetical protein
MGAPPGSAAWERRLGAPPGSAAWERRLGASPGSAAWERRHPGGFSIRYVVAEAKPASRRRSRPGPCRLLN